MKKFAFIYLPLILLATGAFAQNNKMIYSTRSRVFHPTDANDTLNTLQAARTLGTKQIEWMYCADDKKLSLLRNEGIKYGLAINPQIPDSGTYTTTKYRIKDINGEPYVAPRMKNWKVKNPYWGCVNNPGFKQLFFNQTKKLMSLGAYSIVVDDANFNLKLQHDRPHSYGCFCDYCIRGFSKYLSDTGGGNMSPDALKQKFREILSNNDTSSGENKKLLNTYEKYQHVSVVKFLTEWRNEMKSQNPGIILMANNANGAWNDVYSVFDSGIAELNPNMLDRLDSLYAEADRMHKTQLFTLSSNSLNEQYYLLTYNFLHNRRSVAPWDVYVGGSDNKRFSASLPQIKHLTKMFDDVAPGSVGTTTRSDGADATTFTTTVRKRSGGSMNITFVNRKRRGDAGSRATRLLGRLTDKPADLSGSSGKFDVQISEGKN